MRLAVPRFSLAHVRSPSRRSTVPRRRPHRVNLSRFSCPGGQEDGFATKLQLSDPLLGSPTTPPTLICWPRDVPARKSTTPMDGFAEYLENHPSGGTSAHVQVPHAATHWLASHGEANWLQNTKRKTALLGPLPLQLTWGCEAFAFFGSTIDPRIVKAAQRLCRESGFPVVIRPLDSYPGFDADTPGDASKGAQNGGDADASGTGDGDGAQGEGGDGGKEADGDDGGKEGSGDGGEEGNPAAWTTWVGPTRDSTLKVQEDPG
ncbi:hypothetical protein C8F01DRAFT_1113479 [Mycena amicta]|nr:hypothetical protein C8F01DRAFT_1113479 [Mycena amicta]